MKNFLLLFSIIINLAVHAQVSFTRLPNQPPANIYSVVTDPANGDIYACTLNSVIKSTDQGTTWTQVANPAMNQVNVLYFSATGQMYAGGNANNITSTNGITKYNKGSNTWSVMTGSPLNVTSIIDDGAGNIFAGTGSTGNTLPNPVNFGTGVYLFNGTTWTAINTGMANLIGYTVLPLIKDLKILSNGNIIAATYGNGVLKYSGGTWSQYGTGLSSQNVNCLFINSSGIIYAGTDVNVSVLGGTVWSVSNIGLTANKPVRVLVADATGTMYAGLGFYLYQKGSIKGEIFYSTNNGVLWQNAAAGFNSTSVVSMVLHSSGIVFAAANGLWKTASPNNWVYTMGSVPLANNTLQMIQNSQGDWFTICRNPSGAIPGCAGVFRSTDKGLTWVSVNNGINCQRTDGIIADSQGWLWLTTKEFIGASLNPAFGNPELYYSTDNGNNWTKENTIENTTDGYNEIADDGQGRVFVTESFNGVQTNICSSTNHGAFQNNLQPPPNNGGKSFGLAINSLHQIFHGTETTQGLYRSVANGAPGTFVSLETPGVGYAPNGNVNVFVDPNTDYLFCSGTHGLLNGNPLSKNILGSSNTDNGSNLFIFNNIPDFTSLTGMAFDNRGNCYMSINGSVPSVIGLYFGTFPWNTNTTFSRVISSGTSSYFFNDFMIDDCGYLYGMGLSGGGVSKSNLPVNTPLQSTLTAPANNATGISVTPVLSWTHKCTPDSFRLQIASDSLFTNVVIDQAAITATNYTVPAAILNAVTKYYWRVYAVNAAGTGKWSRTNNFTTAATLPLTFISFTAAYNRNSKLVQLNWVTANEINSLYFIIEKSDDGRAFTTIGNIPAALQTSTYNSYSLNDKNDVSGKKFYRVKQVDAYGSYHYSSIIMVTVNYNSHTGLTVFPNPVRDICTIQMPASLKGYNLVITDAKGQHLLQINSLINQKSIAINFNRFASGAYYIRLTDIQTGVCIKQKIIKY